jgi:hypothetical protein
MRRLAIATLLTLMFLSGSALPGWAGSAGVSGGFLRAPVGPATPGKAVCTVSGSGLTELSGLAVNGSQYVAMNDSNIDASAMRVFVLDKSCRKVRSFSYPAQGRDPEDLLIKDGVVWVADTGDDPLKPSRPRIAVWRVPLNGSASGPFRFAYPDGPHDCEAMVFNAKGLPIFITKVATEGAVGVYEATTKWDPSGNPVPLTKVGVMKVQATGTESGMSSIGQKLVTGAATSPDGKRVVVRTYSDAYEFDVTGGDVAKAITTGTPRITPLPNEPQGEAITYSADGKYFLTLSDLTDKPTTIMRYTPMTPAKAAPTKAPADSGGSLLSGLGLSQATNIVIGVGVLGAVLIVAGLIGITRARRRRREEPDHEDGDGYEGYEGYEGYGDGGHGSPTYAEGYPDRGGVYGSGVYGAGAPQAPQGGVYGGGRGGTYGGEGYGGYAEDPEPSGTYGRRRGGYAEDPEPSGRRGRGQAGGRDGYGGYAEDPEPSGTYGRRRGGYAEDPEPSGRRGRGQAGGRDGYGGYAEDREPSGGYDRGFFGDEEPSGGYDRRPGGGRTYGRRDPDGR